VGRLVHVTLGSASRWSASCPAAEAGAAPWLAVLARPAGHPTRAAELGHAAVRAEGDRPRPSLDRSSHRPHARPAGRRNAPSNPPPGTSPTVIHWIVTVGRPVRRPGLARTRCSQPKRGDLRPSRPAAVRVTITW